MSDGKPPPASPARRYAEALVCVAAWMGVGRLLHLDANQYLLLGVPITLLFQLLVRRQPVRALWVREAPPFRLGRAGVVIAAVLALVPMLELLGQLADGDWVGSLYSLSQMAGAVAAAYALRHFRRDSLRPLVGCVLVGLVLDLIQWTILLRFHLVELNEVEGGVMARVAVGV